MSEMNLWFALLGGEVVLILLGLLTYSWVQSKRLRNRDRKAMQTLVAKVKKRKGDREAAIREMLSQRFKLADNQLEASATAILREEMSLYQQFVHLYAKRDAAAATNFNITFEARVAPYWSLPEQQLNTADESPERRGADAEEFQRLIRENKELRDELQVTMETMTRMLEEYTSTFGSDLAATGAGAVPGGEAKAEDQAEGEALAEDVVVDGPGVGGQEDLAQPDDSLAVETSESMVESEADHHVSGAGLQSGGDVEASTSPAGAALLATEGLDDLRASVDNAAVDALNQRQKRTVTSEADDDKSVSI